MLFSTFFYSVYSIFPSIFPTGTTIFNPEKTWSGFILMMLHFHGATLIDMNGNIIRQWKELANVPSPSYASWRLCDGGDEPRRPHQEAIAPFSQTGMAMKSGGMIVRAGGNRRVEKDDGGTLEAKQSGHHAFIATTKEGNPIVIMLPTWNPA